MEEKKKTAREIIEGYQGPPVRIMEVCGTHTHEIFRLGIRKLLPPQVELIFIRKNRKQYYESIYKDYCSTAQIA